MNTIIPRAIRVDRRLTKGTVFVPKPSHSFLSNGPAQTRDLIKAIQRFAAFAGKAFISTATVDKLRTDPYFKYVFSALVFDFYNVYDTVQHPVNLSSRGQRLALILTNPELTTDEELFHGLSDYMNNFPRFMPGGSGRRLFTGDPILAWVRMIRSIDTVLAEQGLMQKVQELGVAHEADIVNKNFDEGAYSRHLEFMKLSLDVFIVLVDRFKLPRRTLRA